MKAYELIEIKDKWVTYTYAAFFDLARGQLQSLSPWHGGANRWSMEGAIMRCYGSKMGDPAYAAAINKVHDVLVKKYSNKDGRGEFTASISQFNDNEAVTHEMVIAILKGADV